MYPGREWDLRDVCARAQSVDQLQSLMPLIIVGRWCRDVSPSGSILMVGNADFKTHTNIIVAVHSNSHDEAAIEAADLAPFSKLNLLRANPNSYVRHVCGSKVTQAHNVGATIKDIGIGPLYIRGFVIFLLIK